MRLENAFVDLSFLPLSLPAFIHVGSGAWNNDYQTAKEMLPLQVTSQYMLNIYLGCCKSSVTSAFQLSSQKLSPVG
ncbi:unnamed protein product [Victoria cruziana]